MEHLTNEQLQETSNKLRDELVRKMGDRKTTPKNLLSFLDLDLMDINKKLNEVTAEIKKRGVNLI